MSVDFEGVFASKKEWEAVGATVYEAPDPRSGPVVRFTDQSGRNYQLFLKACFAVGRTVGSDVIAWMLTERTRQDEERSRVAASTRESESINKLHAAIERLTDRLDAFVERLKEVQ